MDFLLYLPILLFSVIIHEFAHGYSAYRLGDDTAYLSGRLTLNPVAHIDPVGTIILPGILYMVGWPMFGWAKPVPVNPYRLRNPIKDMPKVAFAGPLSNMILVAVAILVFKGLMMAGVLNHTVVKLLIYTITINLVLAIFNMVPVPPLDGSKVLAGFLPYEAAKKYMSLERYGMFIVIALIISGAFGKIIVPVFNFVLKLILSFLGI